MHQLYSGWQTGKLIRFERIPWQRVACIYAQTGTSSENWRHHVVRINLWVTDEGFAAFDCSTPSIPANKKRTDIRMDICSFWQGMRDSVHLRFAQIKVRTSVCAGSYSIPQVCCILWFESIIRTEKIRGIPFGCLLFLAGDEGFEPPQTESESGVLPLHKSPLS